MRIVAIVVGIDNWIAFTERFIRQLLERSEKLEILVVDNGSGEPYPDDGYYDLLRLPHLVGYNHALNAGLIHAGRADWYICLNNDCQCYGDVFEAVKGLDPNTLYGSGDNYDKENKMHFQWSAWLVISRRIFRKVGLFDPKLVGAFEDFDYQLRALAAGFKLEEAKLPIDHLDKHTRFDTPIYNHRWALSREHFVNKWKLQVPDWLKHEF